MIFTAAQIVIYRADLVDPTSDGILTTLVNFGLAALMVLAVLVGGWQAFNVWMAKKGAAAHMELRTVVFGVLLVEMILGGIMWLANYGTGLIENFR